MYKKEFERNYCPRCEKWADCNDGCAPYHDCDDDPRPNYLEDTNKLFSTINDLRRVCKDVHFKVISFRMTKDDAVLHLDSPEVVKAIADEVGVDWETTDAGVKCWYAGTTIIGLTW